MRTITTTLGQLECHVVEEEGASPTHAVVLCHGFGAGGDDLVPLGGELCRLRPEIRGRVRFVFPEAPLTLGDMGYGMARAWWMLDLQSMAARRSGDPEAILRHRREVPEGLGRARRLLQGALEALRLPMERVVLGGFSQGAMLTTDLGLRLDEPPAALWLLSGSLIAEQEWRRLAPRRAGLQVVQSHGTEDPLLPFSSAQALGQLLGEAGLEVEFLPFAGEHTIPAQVLPRLADQLAGLLGERA